MVGLGTLAPVSLGTHSVPRLGFNPHCCNSKPKRWSSWKLSKRWGCVWGLTWRSSSDSRMMLDRSPLSCLATFFHFTSAPLSVSSTSEDSWEIQAVPPSDTREKMSGSETPRPASPPPQDACVLPTPFRMIPMGREGVSRSHRKARPHLGW